MAATNQCLASLARLSLSTTSRPTAAISRAARPLLQTTCASQVRYAGAGGTRKREKKKKTYKEFKVWDKEKLEQYSLCDAMRYIRAFEVGRNPMSVKYSVALKLKTMKSGPVIRNRIRLPHPVKSDVRIGVIAKEDSAAAQEARQGGAVAVGEESLFEAIRAGNIPFNRLICHSDSVMALNAAKLGRVLGPKGLMPSMKTKTITGDVKGLMRELVGADEYREREGTVRMAVGQLGFSPEQLADNVKVFMKQIKSDIGAVDDSFTKEVDDIVLSSTNGPGFSLSGGFNPTDDKITPAHLAGQM